MKCPITLGEYEELKREIIPCRLYDAVCEHCFRSNIFRNYKPIVGEIVFKCSCGEDVLVQEEDFMKIDNI